MAGRPGSQELLLSLLVVQGHSGVTLCCLPHAGRELGQKRSIWDSNQCSHWKPALRRRRLNILTTSQHWPRISPRLSVVMHRACKKVIRNVSYENIVWTGKSGGGCTSASLSELVASHKLFTGPSCVAHGLCQGRGPMNGPKACCVSWGLRGLRIYTRLRILRNYLSPAAFQMPCQQFSPLYLVKLNEEELGQGSFFF